MEKIYLVIGHENYEDGGKSYRHNFVLTAYKTRELAVKFVKDYIEQAKEDIMEEHSRQIPDNYKFEDVNYDDLDRHGHYLTVTSKIPERGPMRYYINIREMEVMED